VNWESREHLYTEDYVNMVFRNFNIGLIIRITLLLINVFLTAITVAMIGEKDLFFLPLILLFILVLQIVDFILFTNRISRSLSKFIDTLKSADHTIKFEDNKAGLPFRKLYKTFNEVTAFIQELKLEKEAQYEYLQSVISHMNIGIISLKDNNEIEFINKSALEILGITQPENWQELGGKIPEFVMETDKIKGKGSCLIEFTAAKTVKRLSVKVSTLIIFKEEFRIITFQDIRSEIEQKEVEAWQKLIKILRHEIMNSVTPISSMTETILMLVEDHLGNPKQASELTSDDIADIRESVITIHDRSEGLNQFVELYREVTRIPDPKIEPIMVPKLIERTLKLFETNLSESGINTRVVNKNPVLKIFADPSLIEQVLINILKNSVEALSQTTDKKIEIKSEGGQESQMITVTDNGSGIPDKDIDDIFVPFYSTKENGSGIGLSLSRQIMHMHGGQIIATSKPGIETSFSLVFYSD